VGDRPSREKEFERENATRSFLKTAGLGAAIREPLAGDASTRRYERVYPASGPSLILMDQPPAVETQPCPPDATPDQRRALGYNAMARLAAGRVEAFVACAAYLRSLGLSAPKIVFADAPAGFALLEDLGDDLFARLTEDGAAEAPLYAGAVQALARIHEATPPNVLRGAGAQWPLLTYDDLALKTGGDLLPEWLPRFTPSLRIGEAALAEWEAFWAPVRKRGEAGASVFCHRDYHAENLLWLAGRQGPSRVGMLDFQDALRAHPAWDMSMLLHDARRDVAPALETAALDAYFKLRPQVDRDAFVADFHALGALNICRILGLFARLVVRDSKPRYAAFMPRLWRYLDRCLADPDLAGLKAWFASHAPAEARAA
jgi:aminoglycoside/choline kinase family phosphotransferase